MANNRGFKVIDAHNHPDWLGLDMNGVLANMDQFGIDQTWMLSWECPENEYSPSYNSRINGPVLGSSKGPISFSRCLSYRERAPERFVIGHAPDPRDPRAIDCMKAAMELYGAKICGELKLRLMLDDFDALRLYRFCGQAGLPVTVHLDYEFATGQDYPRPNYWYGGGMEAFERAVAKCPDTIFLGHAPGFWAHISGDDQFDKAAYPQGPILPGGKLIEMLRKYPNLCCDGSAGSGCNALKRDPAFARDFLIEFQDRYLYARDQFDNIHQEFLDSLNLPAEVQKKIYGGNAQRLIKA